MTRINHIVHKVITLIFFRWHRAETRIIFDTLILIFSILVLMIGLSTLINPLKHGLTVSYYNNSEWSGSPIMTMGEHSIGLDGIKWRFPSVTRHYSIDWKGFIFIPISGTYHFTTVSDDGSALHIDRQLVVDNKGLHGLQERTGTIDLQKGFHSIHVGYMQGGGLAIFRTYWTQPGQAREDLSKASLFEREVSMKRFFLGRVMDMMSMISKFLMIVCVLSGVVFVIHRNQQKFSPLVKTLFISVLVFLIVFISHGFWSGITNAYDSLWSIHTTLSMLREGDTTLDEYREFVEMHRFFAIENIDSHVYGWYPIGTPLIALPYVFTIDKFLKNSLGVDLHTFVRQDIPAGIPQGLERCIASSIVALCVVFMYLISRIMFDRQTYSLFFVFIFAFCTSAWSVASRGLWQHGPSMLLLSVSLYLLLLARNTPKYEPWLIRLVSIPLAFSYVVRPTNSVSIFILTLFILIRYRKHFLSYCLWSFIIIIPFVLFNLNVYHSILPSYYTSSDQMQFFNLDYLEALAGTLFSPSRGLFIYSSVLIFSLYGIFLKINNKQMDLLDYCLLAIIVLHWVISSSHPAWWGGYSYGPRYFTDVLPYFMYFLAAPLMKLAQLRRIKKAIFALLLVCSVAMSFFIHYRGATTEDVYTWNSYPVSVDINSSRLWDLRDVQFLRGIQ